MGRYPHLSFRVQVKDSANLASDVFPMRCCHSPFCERMKHVIRIEQYGLYANKSKSWKAKTQQTRFEDQQDHESRQQKLDEYKKNRERERRLIQEANKKTLCLFSDLRDRRHRLYNILVDASSSMKFPIDKGGHIDEGTQMRSGLARRGEEAGMLVLPLFER